MESLNKQAQKGRIVVDWIVRNIDRYFLHEYGRIFNSISEDSKKVIH